MWVFLSDAFLSIVAVSKDQMCVRARLRGDIRRVFPGSYVYEADDTDYRFRTFVTRLAVKNALASYVDGIEYTNFKNSVTDTERHETYFDVWRTMHDAQTREQWGERGLVLRGEEKPLPPEIVPPPLAPESIAAMKRKRKGAKR